MGVGTLVWWSPDRGFGPIRADSDGKDIFLHASALQEAGIHAINVRIGQRLLYESGEHNGKPKAIDVKMV